MPHPARTASIAWLVVPVTVVLAAAAWLAVSPLTRASVPPPANTAVAKAGSVAPPPGPACHRRQHGHGAGRATPEQSPP